MPILNWVSVMQETGNRNDCSVISLPSILDNRMKKLENVISVLLIIVQISSPLPFLWDFWSISPAKAVLYSPDTKVPRTGELALRRAIPANTNMKAIQVCVCRFALVNSTVDFMTTKVIKLQLSSRILLRRYHIY